MKPPEWSWQGATALTLAIGIFLAETILCIGESVKLLNNYELSQAGINLITATLSTLVGAVATFIGGRMPTAKKSEAPK